MHTEFTWIIRDLIFYTCSVDPIWYAFLHSFAEIKVGLELKQIWNDIYGKWICNTVVLIGSVCKRDLCYFCSFRDNEVVRTCGFAWLPLFKVFQPAKGVPWTPFCGGLLSSAYETGRSLSYFLYLCYVLC